MSIKRYDTRRTTNRLITLESFLTVLIVGLIVAALILGWVALRLLTG